MLRIKGIKTKYYLLSIKATQDNIRKKCKHGKNMNLTNKNFSTTFFQMKSFN